MGCNARKTNKQTNIVVLLILQFLSEVDRTSKWDMMVKKTADVSQHSFLICNTSKVTSSLKRRLVYERSVSNW